ncbi:amidase-like [Mercenaria mercenaria]|uniref:amidase-like n=1 Tax=Mercenaria mercenaria TaxID=6596 RepID=UPI00234EE885|nr:amidase-like [Mercenaria mercenaria]
MMNGSRVMEGFVPDIDATVITKVLDAGGRIIGKTNCEHLCFGGTSWTNDTGPALNPHDKTRVSGGSSSGCAVAVCNGEVDVAIGADQGGSIRIPASWCGIVGLKPTWGLVPYTGAVAMEITVDHLGPMARNVYDCALFLEVMACYDNGLDPRQPRDLQVPKYTEYLKPTLWLRFLDDVFMIWDHSLDELNSFVKALNELHSSIKFTYEISTKHVSFLDVDLTKDTSNNICTNVHVKNTNIHQYLLYSSNHPKTCKDGIPYSQAKRYRRIISDDNQFAKSLDTLREFFKSRNYPDSVIDAAFNKMHNVTQDEALKYNNNSDQVDIVPFVTEYNPSLPNIASIIHKYWDLFKLSPNVSVQQLHSSRPVLAYKRGKNLKDFLVKSRYSAMPPTPISARSSKCYRPRCTHCSKIVETDEFVSSSNSSILLSEGFTGCDDDVQAVVRGAAETLGKVGAIVEDVSIPLHTHGIAIWQPIITDGAYRCMFTGNGVGHHYKGYYAESMMTKLSQGYKMDARHFSEPVKSAVLFAEYIEKNYGNRFYGRAQNLNMKLTQAYDDALSTYDVIVMPTLPFTAPLLPTSKSSITERLENAFGMFKNTAPFDSTGHPAITVNAGKSNGLPVGIMIIGKRFEDVKVLQSAYALEKLQDQN